MITLELTQRAADLLAVLILDSKLPLTTPIDQAADVGIAAGELVDAVRTTLRP